MNKLIVTIAVCCLLVSCSDENPHQPVDVPGKFVFGAGEILVADNAGTRQVTATDTLIYENKFHPTWSPDGEYILYSYLRMDTTGGIYLIKQDGTGNRPILLQGTGLPWWRASISPDGKYLAAVRISVDEGSQLEVYSLNESYQPQFLDLVECQKYLRSFAWSPDSKLIACICSEYGPDNLSIYSIADGTIDDLTSSYPGGYMEEPSWSFQSDKIAFVLNEDIFVINVDGSGFQNLTETSEVAESNVAWSPVFDELVFTAHGMMPDQLSLLDFGTGQKEILYKAGWEDDLHESNFKWSGNGDLISFYISGEVNALHTIKREGGDISLIPDSDGQDFDWY